MHKIANKLKFNEKQFFQNYWKVKYIYEKPVKDGPAFWRSKIPSDLYF